MADESLAMGLVDRLGYYDEAKAAATVNGGEPLDVGEYAARAPQNKAKQKIALVYGVGAIQRGKSQANPLSNAPVMGAETVAKALRDAIDDQDVKAILFRVDSPGGSYVASDVVWREVQRAKTAGKPVIASLGDVAASGGYFVSMGANVVVAQPGTVTGSIGVFAGKIVLDDFWKKLGVHWDEVHSGENAPIWSTNREFTPEAWARMGEMLDRIYADFTTKAAAGRGLDPQSMDRLARGRIWSGAEARAQGLVDELGGYGVALRLAKEAAGIPVDQAVAVEQFPQPKAPLQFLLELLRTGRMPEGGASLSGDLARLAAILGPMLRALESWETRGPHLRMPHMDMRD
jgi:protease-4